MANNYTECAFDFHVALENKETIEQALSLAEELTPKLIAVLIKRDDREAFNALLTDLTPAERIAIKTVVESDELELMDDDYKDMAESEEGIREDQSYELSIGFNYSIDEVQYPENSNLARVYVGSDESINIDNAANFVQAVLQEFNMEDLVCIEGAFTCSKPRPGEFGGFALAVTKDHITGDYTHHMFEAERRANKEKEQYHVVGFTELNSGYEYGDKFILVTEKGADATVKAKEVLMEWRGEAVSVDEEQGLVWFDDGLAAKLHFTIEKIDAFKASILGEHLVKMYR